MIYGFSSQGNTNQVVDRCVATGVHLARSQDWQTSQSVAATEAMVLYAAQRGVKLLLLYNTSAGPDMPIGNLVAQMARVGPNGTLWAGGNAQYAQWAPTHIECGNEYSYSYRGTPATSAVGVANTVKRFYDAVGVNTAHDMQFICEGEDASSGTDAFLNSLVATQPTIRNMVDGWVIHGYGPPVQETSQHWGYPNFQRLHNRLNARGWTTDKIWITENGIATDNGPTMTVGGGPNNYGYKYNCTYAEAATRILATARHHGTSAPWSSRVYCYLQYQASDQQGSGSGQREHYFGIYKSDGSAKGALTSAAVQLATEFPYGGTTPPPPPPPPGEAPNFVIDGQTMIWSAVSGATSYKTYESDLAPAPYKTHGTGVLSFTPAARPPGTSINVGWTYVDALGDHWVAEQVMTWPASTTALIGRSVMTFSAEATAIESASQSAEITDVVQRSVGTKTYSIMAPFQISTGRELIWDPVVQKYFYKP